MYTGRKGKSLILHINLDKPDYGTCLMTCPGKECFVSPEFSSIWVDEASELIITCKGLSNALKLKIEGNPSLESNYISYLLYQGLTTLYLNNYVEIKASLPGASKWEIYLAKLVSYQNYYVLKVASEQLLYVTDNGNSDVGNILTDDITQAILFTNLNSIIESEYIVYSETKTIKAINDDYIPTDPGKYNLFLYELKIHLPEADAMLSIEWGFSIIPIGDKGYQGESKLITITQDSAGIMSLTVIPDKDRISYTGGTVLFNITAIGNVLNSIYYKEKNKNLWISIPNNKLILNYPENTEWAKTFDYVFAIRKNGYIYRKVEVSIILDMYLESAYYGVCDSPPETTSLIEGYEGLFGSTKRTLSSNIATINLSVDNYCCWLAFPYKTWNLLSWKDLLDVDIKDLFNPSDFIRYGMTYTIIDNYIVYKIYHSSYVIMDYVIKLLKK